MRQKGWDFFIFFCLLVVGETRDWITSARPLQSRSASRFPSRFSAAHIIHTAQLSAGCRTRPKLFLPPTPHSILSPPLPHAHFFFLAFSTTTTTLQFTCLPFLPLVSTHTHTFVDPRCPGGERTFWEGMSVFQSHLYTRPRHTDTHTQKKLGNSCC